MTRPPRTRARRSFASGEIALALVVAVGLALPLLPVPGDSRARMAVRFHAPGMAAERRFVAVTSMSACSILAAVLEYEDRETGNFTHITCE